LSAHSLHRLTGIVMLVALIVVCGTRAGLAQALQRPGETSLCVYQDRTYSEGAAICPQTRFMLMCSADGARLVWKAVADRAVADRCLRPTVAADLPVRPLHRQRIARTSPPVAGTSARCFTFNNRQYCE
jgi:hypothetical protein